MDALKEERKERERERENCVTGRRKQAFRTTCCW
jgi:hypothetical protein